MGEKWEVYHQTDDDNNLFCVLSRDELNARIIAMSFTQKEEAHLLAASPLMLEALKRMVKYKEAADGTEAEDAYLNLARAAIAAAKGEGEPPE